MWTLLNYILLLDDYVRKLGILIVSSCNWCWHIKEETLDIFMSTKNVATYVWKYAVALMCIFYVEGETWRMKVAQWFINARKTTLIGKIISSLPVIITWKLWLCRCKARMEDKHDSGVAVWTSVKHWLVKVTTGMTGSSSEKAIRILEEFRLTPMVKNHQ